MTMFQKIYFWSILVINTITAPINLHHFEVTREVIYLFAAVFSILLAVIAAIVLKVFK